MEKFIDSKDIINIMNDYCKEHHISITHFAKLAGVSKAWLSRLQNENDKKISLYIAQRLLSVAGYSIKITKGNTKISKIRRLRKVYSNEIDK